MSTVAELRVYPIKSCRGVSVPQARVVRRGLAADRRWMVVDADGRFVTQREVPRMTLVQVRAGGDTMHLTAPHMPELTLPLEPTHGECREVEVWEDRVAALAHPDGSAWVARLLGPGHELVFMPDTTDRPVAPGYDGGGGIVSFADAFPFLLTSESSLAELNARMHEPLPMERFRPNIVVDGAAPFAEDEWTTLRIGDIPFRMVKHCVRCSITTVDPDTAERGKEPLATLATFRRNDSGGVTFGVNLVHEGTGTLRVGDAVVPD